MATAGALDVQENPGKISSVESPAPTSAAAEPAAAPAEAPGADATPQALSAEAGTAQQPTSNTPMPKATGANLNPEFALSDLPPDLATALKAFDLDDSGTVDAAELSEAAYTFRRAKEQAALFKKVAIGFALALVVVLFMNMGLTAAAIELSRDTRVSDGGTMKTTNGETVQVASSDMRIDASGALVMRSQETPETNARRLQSTGVHSDAGGLNMAIGVRQQYQRRELSSTMPDEYFKELVWFELESPSGSTVALRVSSIVRVPRQSAACGSVLVLATSLGRVTLDDTTLAFDHELGLLFTEAGFAVQAADGAADEVLNAVAGSTGGRRGRSLQRATMVGFFNAIDDVEWTCSTVAKPSMPAVYSAQINVLNPCKLEGDERNDPCRILVGGDVVRAPGIQMYQGAEYIKSTRHVFINSTDTILVEHSPLHPTQAHITHTRDDETKYWQVSRAGGLAHCEKSDQPLSLGLPEDYIFHYVGEVGDMRRFRISYQQGGSDRWQHIDYFDDIDTKIPKLLLLDTVYLEMHSVKQGADMDTFEALGYGTVRDAAWSSCEHATDAVRENRAGEYNNAFNLTMAEEGAPVQDSVLAGIEYSNATAVLGVARDAHPRVDLDAEVDAWDWRLPYPPKVQGPNSYHSGDVNWYAGQAEDNAAMFDAMYMDWFYMNQQADREHFEMVTNGTITTHDHDPARRTMSGNPVQRAGRRLNHRRRKIDIGFLEYEADSSVPVLSVSADWRRVTFELEVSGKGNSLAVTFEAYGCIYEVLCLTGTGEFSDPVRHFTLSVDVTLKVSNVVDDVLSPLPGVVKDIIVDFVASVFDKEYGRIQYDYYRSARIHEKWERIKACAPCHILKARLNIYSGHWAVDPHLRGFIGVAAVWAPGFAAHGVYKKHKKDELWNVTDGNKHLFMQGNLGFEYKIPGLGWFTGWQTGWSLQLFKVSKADGSRSWWSGSQKRSRVDNSIHKAWDYKYGWGGNDKVDQFYY